MSKLRDFFAAVGFCESTADLERKPALIEDIIQKSKSFTPPQPVLEPPSNYETRLRMALGEASSVSLEQIAKNNVIVVLDRRFSNLETGFWDSTLHAAYYIKDKNKILSLYDNGKKDAGFFDDNITDFSGDVIDQLAQRGFHGNEQDILIGHTYFNAATKTTYFEWDTADQFSSELKKNPGILKPPVKLPPSLTMDMTGYTA